jgi:hypothetical protein
MAALITDVAVNKGNNILDSVVGGSFFVLVNPDSHDGTYHLNEPYVIHGLEFSRQRRPRAAISSGDNIRLISLASTGSSISISR